MGHIKEPAGVDLVINGRPLTKEEEIALSKYIRAYKAKRTRKKTLTRSKKASFSKRRIAA